VGYTKRGEVIRRGERSVKGYTKNKEVVEGLKGRGCSRFEEEGRGGLYKREEIADGIYEEAGTGKKNNAEERRERAEERKARIQKGENEIY
jgi:hypothetical protein